MKLDKNGRITIPARLFQEVGFNLYPNNVRIALGSNNVLLFRADDQSMSDVEYHDIANFDEKNRIFLPKWYRQKHDLASKDLIVGVRRNTVIIRW
ncbi:MAG: hypothetical protein Q4C11_03315 [Clostridium sp.]|jgi:DNA-binding transcriptional regulator/RsmH inhibitor MraZ|nr:hypothetical protein [Clostridium sp.]